MSSELQREVYRGLHESQSKYTYFLLAAAGAAIGFSLSQTQNVGFSFSQTPLGLAVLFWGLSFYFGCRHLEYVSSIMYANFAMLEIESGQHLDVGDHLQKIKAASEGVKEAIENNSNAANLLGHLQFSTLITGAILYVALHILEMYLRT